MVKALKTSFLVGTLTASLIGAGIGTASADLLNSIATSASGVVSGELYGYSFTISETGDSLIYHAVLDNISSAASGAMIDKMAFNISADLGTDFAIENVTPSWTFGVPNGNGVQFDYVGNADGPGSTNKIAPGDGLAFDFHFAMDFTPSFDLWTSPAATLGTGIGGGTDEGQVAVRFQSLSPTGSSDLLASSWMPSVTSSTEPGTLVLLGTGLLGVATLLRRRQR